MNQEKKYKSRPFCKGRIKGIVFDFDGTLLDSTREGLNRFIQIATNLGLEVNDEMIATIKNMWGVPGHILIAECWPHMSSEMFMHEWETFDSVHPIALFPGVENVLADIAQRVSLSLLTARSWSTHAQLRLHGIHEHFCFVCTLDDSPMSKPHPESIKPVLEHYHESGIGLNNLVFVGDSVRADYALARALGIDFIALTWGSSSRSDFLAAGLDNSCIIDTLEDLPPILFA
ncbi:MAG: hypothetical protein G01um101466_698 [Parcubacteria group bacterium Gr01-1014_66]|nr:MAG: hypothetical protein G01um101466_698 [Parcubacteria group bacterium Gr01-1014_66]